MQLANCKECGRLFRRITSDLCGECREEEEEQLRRIREYLREHKRATIEAVAEELDIKESRIERWVQEERITLVNPEADEAKAKCASCGREVRPGERFCRTCIFKQLQSQSRGPEDKSKPEGKGMHYKARQ